MFIKHASRKGIGIGNYEYEVADALYVDKSAVHNWRMGVNGPGDLEKIQLLAKLWNVKCEILLTEVKEMSTTMEKQMLTDREKAALKNVYCSFLNYMNVFEKTAGFVWNEDNSDFDFKIAYRLFEQTKYTLEQEYIDLKRTLYNELKKFFNEELTYTLQGEYFEEEGDTPEMQIGMAESIYEDMVGKFKDIISIYLS